MIPRDELSPGVVQVKIVGEDGAPPVPVYVDQAALKMGPLRHDTLPDEMLAQIMTLATDLAEVHPMTFEAWVDGFARDMNPAPEVAGWLHLAAIFKLLSARYAFDLPQKKECFRLLLTCFLGDHASVRERLDSKLLTEEQIELAIRYFYESGY